MGGTRGNNVEIALSNAINYIDYQRNIIFAVTVRARECPKDTNETSAKINGLPQKRDVLDLAN